MPNATQTNNILPIAISATEAKAMMDSDELVYLVDIRSSMEFLFIGHPIGAVHIPWMDEPDWDINPHFVADIRKLLLGGVACSNKDHCAKIILICRSGNRSEIAGKALIKAGLKQVYHIVDGFEGDKDENQHRSSINGWRYDGLPWEQC